MKLKLLFVCCLFSLSALAQENPLPLIPLPSKVAKRAGEFMLRDNTLILFSNDSLLSDVSWFAQYVRDFYRTELKPLNSKVKKMQCIHVSRNSSLAPDAYQLTVDSAQIEIEGGSGAGVFYAFQTLRQLLQPAKTDLLSVPCVHVEDAPRFSWRGMHLDVSRHFFSVKEVKKYLDNLAMYKMNVFHWHLTDDQGWRIEIKKYPKLTQVGAWRNGTLIGHYGEQPERYDTLRYGGFYTQDQIREVVAYAASLHITVVPEIEMPGHATAALAAYPEYGCTPGPVDVARTWGVFKDVFCPYEETFNFLESVLSEVSELFPGQYIHIGGDECPKDRWIESPFCQSLMQNNNLKNENELQTYFVNRIGAFLQTKGKKLLGWDEILEGGVPQDATIMSWRGYAGGIAAAQQHHDVVMAPTSYCYFDYYQSTSAGEPLAIGGYLPVQSVYRFEPIADALKPEETKYILGTQANLWTEYITDWKKVEYMTMPRMSALAEVAWTQREKKDYTNYVQRLYNHFKLLRFLGITYSTAVYSVTDRVMPEGSKGISVTLSTDFPKLAIHYSMDGKEPTANSPLYTDKLVLDQPVAIKAAAFEGSNRVSGVLERGYNVGLATGKEIRLTNQPDEEYNHGGAFALIDGLTGRMPWNGADWLGFRGVDCDAIIDLGSQKNFSRVGIDVLCDSASWIYLPIAVEVSTSDDGVTYKPLQTVSSDKIRSSGRLIKMNVGKQTARYIKVTAKNLQTIPTGSPGAGQPAWLFVDEISVE